MTRKFLLVMTLVLSRCVCDCVTEVRNSGLTCAQTPPSLKKNRGELLSTIFSGGSCRL